MTGSVRVIGRTRTHSVTPEPKSTSSSPVSIRGVLAVVPALPMRDVSLCRELRRRAPEARLGGLAFRERGCVALRFWSLCGPVVPRWGLVRGSPARRVLGLEAQHHGRPVPVWWRGGRVGDVGRFVRRPGRGRCPCCPAVAVRRVVHQERLEEPHAGLKQLGARVRGGRRGSERAATGHVRGPGEVLEAGIGGVSVSAELRQEESPLGCCEAPLEDPVLVLCTIAHRRDAGGARGLRLQRA